MIKFVVLACLLAITGATPSRRIVGGGNALPGEVPFQASIRFFGTNFHFAGGSLITNRWVVSTGNYLVGRAQDSINIVVGTTSLTANVINYRSDRIIVHNALNRVTNENNIGLIRSATNIPLTIFVQAIDLGSLLIGTGVTARASGWGSTQPDKGPDSNFLQIRDVQTANCEANGEFATLNQHLCASAAICTTDIGGPLVANNQLIGISMWHDPNVCGSADNQDFYVRVSVFRNWIMGNID